MADNSAEPRRFIVGTAGHIDHGKSTLIEAMTGTDPDRLPEEKARGITIDLGFAHIQLKSAATGDTTFHLGVIDVPGHADFVKNMVAGVGSVNLALFVVAADDGWMPQSEEHLQILTYLGVKKAVIALTKADTVEDPAIRALEISEQLEGTPFEGAPVIPVCALIGEGIDELNAAICLALSEIDPPADIGKPRLAVDRVFSPQGIGTVVTGTLIGGEFKKGQKVITEPGTQNASIRSLQNHSASVDTAYPGTRTAINLPDIAIERSKQRQGMHRGHVITLPNLGQSARRIHVVIDKHTREIPGATKAAHKLRHAQRVRLHHGSAAISARVLFFDNINLGPGETAIAELRLDSPAYTFAGDRFVLRDWSNAFTLAGGTILDPAPPQRSYRKPDQKNFLQARAASNAGVDIFLESLAARDRVLLTKDLLSQSRFSEKEIAAALEKAITNGTISTLGPRLFHAPWWSQITAEAGARVDKLHANNPELPGLPLTTLRAYAKKNLPDEKLFDILIDALCANGYARAGTALRSSSHKPQLPPELQSAGRIVRERLSSNPVEPPSPGELATTPDEKTALKFLQDGGEVITLSDKAILLVSGYQTCIDRVTACLNEKGKATAADLRDAIGTTRRILIPLLERLDKERITLRQGDFRILKK
jgi:selenocysteine-specific elongation factor